jgi:hypothetical protein
MRPSFGRSSFHHASGRVPEASWECLAADEMRGLRIFWRFSENGIIDPVEAWERHERRRIWVDGAAFDFDAGDAFKGTKE